MVRTVLFLAAFAATHAHAQLTESVEVHVLEIEVSVLDKSGLPVAGLKSEDFEVTVDGKPEPVSNFYMVRRGEIVDETLRGGGAVAEPAAAQVVPTRLVLFVDDLHLHQRSKKRSVEMLRKFVEDTMDDVTTAMLVRWNGSLNVLVPATKNRKELLDAIAMMATEPGRMRHVDSERRTLLEMRDSLPPDAWFSHLRNYAESQRRETIQTIAALSETARAVGGLEGRKILIYVSEGLPLLAGWEMLALGDPKGLTPEVMSYDLTSKFRELAKYAQNASVVFCPLDPSGPDGATYAVDVPNGNPNAAIIRENNFNTSTMVARETGGQFIHDTNELDLALARLTDQVTTFYSLGVRAPGGKRGPFNVKVRVRNRPELRVATAPKRSVQSRDEMVANSVRSHLYIREEANPLGATLTVGAPRKDRGRCVVDVGVKVSSKNLTLIPIDDAVRGEIAFHFALLDDKQQESPVRKSAKEIWPRAGADVSELVSLGVKPVKYMLSAALTDNVSGEASYLQREIDATSCR